MLNRIHITGQSRGGTTLLKNLFGVCFKNVFAPLGETHYYQRRDIAPNTILISQCASDANDLDQVEEMLSMPNMDIIFMIRDVRDSMVSEMEGKIHHLNSHTADHLFALPLVQEKAFICKYENLVSDPDALQVSLANYFDLTIAHPFSEGYKYFPSELEHDYQKYLNGIRPIDTNSVGRWQNSPYRQEIEAIINNNPHIKRFLIDYGYERSSEPQSPSGARG